MHKNTLLWKISFTILTNHKDPHMDLKMLLHFEVFYPGNGTVTAWKKEKSLLSNILYHFFCCWLTVDLFYSPIYLTSSALCPGLSGLSACFISLITCSCWPEVFYNCSWKSSLRTYKEVKTSDLEVTIFLFESACRADV